jgi:hypothetical protein
MRPLSCVVMSILVLALPAETAWASWSAPGAGSSSAASRTLDAATISVPVASGAAVAVTWTQQAALVPAAPASGSITYAVERRLGAGDFSPVAGGGCAEPLAHGTTSCTDTVSSNGSYHYRVLASLASWTALSAEAGPVAVDSPLPSVQSIERADASPTNAASVSWAVTFNKPVTGVDASDFQLVRTGGLAGGSVVSVTGSGATRTVTASSGSGSGTLSLALLDDDTVRDAVGNPLGGTGTGNGSLTGQIYTIDRAAPAVSASVIAKTSAWTPGSIRQGGSYYVFADVSDLGDPASGLASVAADVSPVTSGQTAVALSAGTYSAGGVAYTHRSAALTAANPLPEGARSYTVSATDAVANTTTRAGLSVTVDSTAPSASNVQAVNGGSTVGRAEQNDTITYTFSEPIDPHSILSGWTGAAATDVVVRVNEGGLLQTDELLIYNVANSAAVSLGTVALGESGYVSTSRTFGAAGTKSRMLLSATTITVTLGTASGGVTDPLFPGTMTWTPSSSAYDPAGNPMSPSSRTESGPTDKEF